MSPARTGPARNSPARNSSARNSSARNSSARNSPDPVERLRRICLALPEATERASHGEPSFFVRDKKQFVSLDDHHHGADHLAFWCPSAPGAQEQLIAEDPDQFFRPPYVGHRGWVGVRIDGDPDWDEIAAIVTDAYRLVAPKTLAAQLDQC